MVPFGQLCDDWLVKSKQRVFSKCESNIQDVLQVTTTLTICHVRSTYIYI